MHVISATSKVQFRCMETLGLIRVFIPGVSLSSRSDRKPPLAGPEGDPGAEGLLGAGPRLLPSPWAVSRFTCPMSTGRNCAGPRPRRRLERGPVLFGVRGRVPRRQRRLTQGAPASAIWGPRGTQGPGPRRCLGSPGVVMFWGSQNYPYILHFRLGGGSVQGSPAFPHLAP